LVPLVQWLDIDGANGFAPVRAKGRNKVAANEAASAGNDY
jgi:hypothetical protein